MKLSNENENEKEKINEEEKNDKDKEVTSTTNFADLCADWVVDGSDERYY